MILSRSYHQTHPNTSTFTAQGGPAHIDGTEGGGSGSSTSGSAGKAQHGQFGAAVRDSSDATLETLSQLLGRLRSSDYLYSESPAMRGYGARILLQYVQRTPTTPSKVSSGSTKLFFKAYSMLSGLLSKKSGVSSVRSAVVRNLLWQRVRNTPRQQ
jgi:hypothetical protein